MRRRRSRPGWNSSNAPAARTPRPKGRSRSGGIHTGIAYVGPTGPAGAVTDFTALGDVVNTTARLASSAGAGEVLVTIDAATAADAPTAGVEHRIIDVRGREATIETLVLRPAA
jgi:adenylate cyclase